MLVLLAQVAPTYRAHLASGILNAHGVQAHVLHEGAASIYGGGGSMVASLWVPVDDVEDAMEILRTAPEKGEMPLPDDETGVPPTLSLPSFLDLAVGNTLLMFALGMLGNLMFLFFEQTYGRLIMADESDPSTLIAFPRLLITSVLFGLLVACCSAPLFFVIRLYQRQSPPGEFIVLSLTVAILVILCFSWVS